MTKKRPTVREINRLCGALEHLALAAIVYLYAPEDPLNRQTLESWITKALKMVAAKIQGER